ncbi:MAG: sporulation protein YqfC [Clostridium sp.]
MDGKLNKGREFFVDKLQMPKEVVYDIPRIVLVGLDEITIEHHKGIITFGKDSLRINSKLGPIKVTGSNFEILFIGETTITISGKIKSIEYEGVKNA